MLAIEDVDPSYLRLVGAVVHKAIQDAKAGSRSKRKDRDEQTLFWKRDAMDFLFHGERLQNFFNTFGFKNVNVGYIRAEALKGVRNRREEKTIFGIDSEG